MNCTPINCSEDCKCLLTPILTPTQSGIMFTIISLQLIGAIANLICIHMVSRLRNSNILNRPKILMANIAVSDTILTVISIFPRFVLIVFIHEEYPTTTHVIQSIRFFIENLTLYIEAFTMVIISWDRFYALTRVFNNPFDNIETKKVLAVIWIYGVILSTPFIITSKVDYYSFKDKAVICEDMGHYFNDITKNKTFIGTRGYLALATEFAIPTALVTWFSTRIIFHLLKVYRSSVKGIRMTACVQRCEVTKRLITILFIFIMKNIAYIFITGRYPQKLMITDPRCVDPNELYIYFIFYEIFRFTNPMNSVIFFWLSSEFRVHLRYYICDYNMRSRASSREAMVN